MNNNVNQKNIRKKKKQNNSFKSFIVALLIFSLFLGGYFVYDIFFKEAYEVPVVSELKNKKEEMNYSDKDDYNYAPQTTYVNELPNVRKQYNNNNIVARIQIPGLDIDTYVTRTTNNEYYLNHSIYNTYDEVGYPFADYRNKDLKNAKQINVYGHNSQDKSLQHRLELINLRAYLDKNFFDNYKYMYLSLDEGYYQYRVEAIKVVTASDPEHMKVVFYSNDDYLKHAQKLYQNTIYLRDDTTITVNDKLLILQICNYNPKNSYLLVIGKQT